MFSLKISDEGDMDLNSVNVGKGTIRTTTDRKVGFNIDSDSKPNTTFQLGEGSFNVINDSDITAFSLYTTGNYIPLRSNSDASIFISSNNQDSLRNSTGITFGRVSDGGTMIPQSRISGSGKEIVGVDKNINGEFLIDNFSPLNDYVVSSYLQNVVEDVRILQGTTPVIRGIGFDASLSSIVFAENIFTAVSMTGDSNQVYVTVDGKNWLQRVSPPGSFQWSAVTYFRGRFVAGADAQNIMYSDNGLEWQLATIPLNITPISGLAAGSVLQSNVSDPRVVAVTRTQGAAQGTILYSPNGISWTLSAAPARDYRDVAFGSITIDGISQSYYIAVSSQGISRSEDGDIWEDVSQIQNFTSVVFGEQQIVATTSDGKIYWSLDTESWNLAQIIPVLAYTDIAFGNGLYTACASDGISVSRDGIFWILKYSSPNADWKSVTFGRNIFVVVGLNVSLTISTVIETSILTTIERTIPSTVDKLFLDVLDGDAESSVYDVVQLETINGTSVRAVLTNPSKRIVGRADGKAFVSGVHRYSRSGTTYTVTLTKLVPEEYDDIGVGDTVFVNFIDNIDVDTITSTYIVTEKGPNLVKFEGVTGPNISNAECLLFRGTLSNRLKIASDGKVGFTLDPTTHGLETNYDIGIHGGIYNSFSTELTAKIHNKSGDLVAAEDGKPVDIFVPEVNVRNASYTRVGTLVTVTTTSPHSFGVGDDIRISEATGGLMMGNYTILNIIDINTFSFIDSNSVNISGKVTVTNLSKTSVIQTPAWMYTLENKSNIETNQSVSPGLPFTVVVRGDTETVFSILPDRTTPASSIPSVISYQANQSPPLSLPVASIPAIVFRPGIYGYSFQAYNPSTSNSTNLALFDIADRKIKHWPSIPLSRFSDLDVIPGVVNSDIGIVPADGTSEFTGIIIIEKEGPVRLSFSTSIYRQGDRLAQLTMSFTPIESTYNKATFTSTAYDNFNNVYVAGSVVTQNQLNAGLFFEGVSNSRVGQPLDVSPTKREQGVVYKVDSNGKYIWSINFYSITGNIIVSVSTNGPTGDVYVLASLSNATSNNILYRTSYSQTGSVAAKIALFRFNTAGAYLSDTGYESGSDIFPMGADVSNDNHVSLALACKGRIRVKNSSGAFISRFTSNDFGFPAPLTALPQNVSITYTGVSGSPSIFNITNFANTQIQTSGNPDSFELKEDTWTINATVNTSDAFAEEIVYRLDYNYNSTERIIRNTNPIGQTSIFQRYIYGVSQNSFWVGVSKVGGNPLNLSNGVADQQGNYYICSGNYNTGAGNSISFQSFGQSIPGSFGGVDIGKLMVMTFYNTSPVSYSYMRVLDTPSVPTAVAFSRVQAGEFINHSVFTRYVRDSDTIILTKNPGFDNVYIQYLPLSTLFGMTGPYTRSTDNNFEKDPVTSFANIDPPGGEVRYNIIGNYTLTREDTTTYADITITEGAFQDFLPSQLFFDVITGIAKPGVYSASYTNPSSVRLTLPPGVYDITSGTCSLNPPHDFIRKRDNTHIFSADKFSQDHFEGLDLHNVVVSGNFLQTPNPNISKDLFHNIQSGIQQLADLNTANPNSLSLSGSFRPGEKIWLRFDGGEISPFIVSSSDRFRSIVTGEYSATTGDLQSVEILNSYTSSAGNVTVRFPETNTVETSILNSRFVRSGNTFTVTTDEPHGFVPGRRFRSNLTGEHSVQSVVSANVFTFVSATPTSGNEIDILRSANYTRSGTQVTVTTSTPHKLRLNGVISVNSSSGNVANGEYKITQIIDDKSFRFQTLTSGATEGSFNVVYPSHPFVDNGGLIGLKLEDGTMGGFTISSVTNTTVLVSSTGFPNVADGYLWVGNGYSTSNGEITISYPKNDIVEGEYVFLMFENIFKSAKIQFKGTRYSPSTLSWKIPRTDLEYYDAVNGYVRVYRTGYSEIGGDEVQLKIPNHKLIFGDKSRNKFYSPPNIVERVTVNDNIFTSSKNMINGNGFLKLLPNSTNSKTNILAFFEYGHARTPGQNVSFLDEYENGGGFTISGKTYSILTFPPDIFSLILRDDPIPINPRLVYTFVRSGTNMTVTFAGHPFSELDFVRLLFPSNGSPIILDRQVTNATTDTFTVGGISNSGILQTGAVDILPVTVNEILRFRTVTEYSHGRTDQDKVFILNSSNDSSEFDVSNPSTDTYVIITGSGFDFGGKNIIQSFSSSSQDVTVSMKNHGYVFGNEVRLIFPQFNGDSTNVIFSDNYMVTSTTTNTFNVTIPLIQDSASSPVVVTVKSIITPGSFIRITEYTHDRQLGDMVAISEPNNVAHVFPLVFVDLDTYDLDISGSSGSFSQPRLISTFDAAGNGTVTVSAKNHGYTQGQVVGLVFPIFVADGSNVQFSGVYQVSTSSPDSFSVTIAGIQDQISSPVIVTPSISDEIERDIKVISEIGHAREIDDKVALVNSSGSSHVFDIIERDINSYVVDVTDTDVTNPRPIQVFGKSGNDIIVIYNDHGYQQQQRVYLRFPRIIGNAISNEEFSGEYIISSVSTDTFTVNLPGISIQQDSPVEVFEASEVTLQTVKRINEPGHGRQSGDEIGLIGINNISSYFQVSNFSSANEFDVLVGTSVNIEFPEIINSFSSSNSIITVASRGHGYVQNDRVALTFPPQAKFSMDHWITNNLQITAQPTSTSGAYSWRSVTWAPEIGLFVAVSRLGDINRIITSPDGINWTQRVSPNTNSLFSVDWSPELGLFAVVSITGEGDRVITSPDGINWTPRSTPLPNKNWNRVKWIPDLGLFVAVAYSGVGERVMTSPDGINWTSRQSANDNNWSDLEWSPELSIIVAVATASAGLPNRIMTSPDGINWVERVSPGDVGWSSVAWSYTLGLFAAVGFQGEDHRIMTSSDGINWTLKPAPVVAIWRYIRWISELGIFLAVSDRGVDQPDSYIMTSDDGINWVLYNTGPTNNWFNFIWANELQRLVIVSGEPIPKIVTSASYPVSIPNSSFDGVYTITNVSQNNFEVSNPGLGVRTESPVKIERAYTRGSLKAVINYSDQPVNNKIISLLGVNGSANIYKATNVRQGGYAIFGGSLTYPSLPRRVSTYDSAGEVVEIYSISYGQNIQIVSGTQIRLIFHTTDGDSTNNSFSGNYTVQSVTVSDPINNIFVDDEFITVNIPGIGDKTNYSVEIVFKSEVSGTNLIFTIPNHTYSVGDVVAVLGTNNQVGILDIDQRSTDTIRVKRESNTYTNPRIIYTASSSNQTVVINYPDHNYSEYFEIGLIFFEFEGNNNNVHTGGYTITEVTQNTIVVHVPGIPDQSIFPIDISNVYSSVDDIFLSVKHPNHPYGNISDLVVIVNNIPSQYNLFDITQNTYSITLANIPSGLQLEGGIDFGLLFSSSSNSLTLVSPVGDITGTLAARYIKLPLSNTFNDVTKVFNSIYGVFLDSLPKILRISDITFEDAGRIEFVCEPREMENVAPTFGLSLGTTYLIDESLSYSRPFGVVLEDISPNGTAVVTRLSIYNRDGLGTYVISNLQRDFEVGERIFARFIDAPATYSGYNRGDIDAQNDIFTIIGRTLSSITVLSQVIGKPFTNGMVVVDHYLTLPPLASIPVIPVSGQSSISPLIPYRVTSGTFTFFEESLRFNSGDDVFVKFADSSHLSKTFILDNVTPASFSVTESGASFSGERKHAFIEKLVLPGTSQPSSSGNTGISLLADYTQTNGVFTVAYPRNIFGINETIIVRFYNSNISRDATVTVSNIDSFSFTMDTTGLTFPGVKKVSVNRTGLNEFELFNLTTQSSIFTFDPIGRSSSTSISSLQRAITNDSQIVLRSKTNIYSSSTSVASATLLFIPSATALSENQLRISLFKLTSDMTAVVGESAFSTGTPLIEDLGFIDQGLGASRIKEGVVRHDKKTSDSAVYITFRIIERFLMYYFNSGGVFEQRQMKVFSGSVLIGLSGTISFNDIILLSTLRQSNQTFGFVTTTSIDIDRGPRGDSQNPNIYVCGACNGAIDFRGTVRIGDTFLDTRLYNSRTSVGRGAFLCKINAISDLEWFSMFDGSDEENAVSVAVNSDVQEISSGIYGIYVLGSFTSENMQVFDSRKGSIDKSATSILPVESIRKSVTSRDNLIQRESYILKFNQDGQHLVTYKTSSSGLLTPVYLDVGSGDNVIACMKSFATNVSLKEPDGRVARYIGNKILYDVGILIKYRTTNFLNIDATDRLRQGQSIRKKIINKSPFSLYVPVYTSVPGFGRSLTDVFVVPENTQMMLSNNKEAWFASASEKITSDLLYLDRDNGKFGFGTPNPSSTVDVRGDVTVAGLASARDIICSSNFFSRGSLESQNTRNQIVDVKLPSEKSYYLTWIPNLLVVGISSPSNTAFLPINGVYPTGRATFTNLLRTTSFGTEMRTTAVSVYEIDTTITPNSFKIAPGIYKFKAYIVNDTTTRDLVVRLVNSATDQVYGTLATFNSSNTDVVEFSGIITIPVESYVRPIFSNNVYQFESRVSLSLEQEGFKYPYNVNSQALLAKGMIAIWRPSIIINNVPSDIPSGWAICDGRIQNGVKTPDLRARFVLGYSNDITVVRNGTNLLDEPPIVSNADDHNPTGTDYQLGLFNPGDVSGELRNQLNISHLPEHNHIVPWRDSQPDGGTVTANNNYLNSDPVPTYPTLQQILFFQAGITGFTGGTQNHNNTPPYHVLVYICKV